MVLEILSIVVPVVSAILVGIWKAGSVFADIKTSILSLENSVSRLDSTLNQIKVEIQKELDSKMQTHSSVSELNVREKFHAVRNDMNMLKHDAETYTDWAIKEHIEEYHKQR